MIIRIEKMLQALSKEGKKIFTTKEFVRYTDIDKDVAYVYLNRLVKRGVIKKIKRGVYSLTEDVFLVANNLIIPSYFSLSTAYYLNKKFTFMINKFFLCNSKKSQNILIDATEVKFIKIKPRLMFGFVRRRWSDGYIFVAELEKAILDCLYLPRYCRIGWTLEVIKESIDEIDYKKLETFLKMFNIESVRRRLGYLLDLVDVNHNIKPETKTVYKLNPYITRKGQYDSKWRLYINEVLQ